MNFFFVFSLLHFTTHEYFLNTYTSLQIYHIHAYLDLLCRTQRLAKKNEPIFSPVLSVVAVSSFLQSDYTKQTLQQLFLCTIYGYIRCIQMYIFIIYSLFVYQIKTALVRHLCIYIYLYSCIYSDEKHMRTPRLTKIIIYVRYTQSSSFFFILQIQQHFQYLIYMSIYDRIYH